MLVDIRRSRLYSIEAWPLELGFHSSEPVVTDKPRPPPGFYSAEPHSLEPVCAEAWVPPGLYSAEPVVFD